MTLRQLLCRLHHDVLGPPEKTQTNKMCDNREFSETTKLYLKTQLDVQTFIQIASIYCFSNAGDDNASFRYFL